MNQILHSYKPKVILPYIAIIGNIPFLNSNNKTVKTSDGVCCKVVNIYERHICELEKEIKEIYNVDGWAFLKKWHKAYPYMQSMTFVVMELNKI